MFTSSNIDTGETCAVAQIVLGVRCGRRRARSPPRRRRRSRPDCPFLPMTIAVPVSWHIGRMPPAATLAFFSRSSATKRSLSRLASGSSRIAAKLLADATAAADARCRGTPRGSGASAPPAPPSARRLAVRTLAVRDVVRGQPAIRRIALMRRGETSSANVEIRPSARTRHPENRKSRFGTKGGRRDYFFLRKAVERNDLFRRLLRRVIVRRGRFDRIAGIGRRPSVDGRRHRGRDIVRDRSSARNCSPKLTDGSTNETTAIELRTRSRGAPASLVEAQGHLEPGHRRPEESQRTGAAGRSSSPPHRWARRCERDVHPGDEPVRKVM